MKNRAITKLIDKMGEELYGVNPSESMSKGLCIDCKEPALPKCYSNASRKEFYISGLCEVCFDRIFNEWFRNVSRFIPETLKP